MAAVPAGPEEGEHQVGLDRRCAGPLHFCSYWWRAELLLAARSLPYTHPTAPEAVDGVRYSSCPPADRPNRSANAPAASGRFLGLSTITYDPGDRPDYQRIMLEGNPPQLDQAAFDDLVIAQKVQELLVPNLACFGASRLSTALTAGYCPSSATTSSPNC